MVNRVLAVDTRNYGGILEGLENAAGWSYSLLS